MLRQNPYIEYLRNSFSSPFRSVGFQISNVFTDILQPNTYGTTVDNPQTMEIVVKIFHFLFIIY